MRVYVWGVRGKRGAASINPPPHVAL
jgi:hypothetical protein